MALIPPGYVEKGSKPCPMHKGENHCLVFVNDKMEEIYYCPVRGVSFTEGKND